MSVNSTIANQGAAATGSSQQALGSASAVGGSSKDIQDRFLKLLIAQMKAQDPLSPMDNAQVTSQMAQLSTVTGIQDLNSSMKGISTSLNAGELLRATSLIGTGVAIPGSRVGVAESGASAMGFQLDGPADSVRLDVTDAAGNVIYNKDAGNMSAGYGSVQWDGNDASGNRVPPGVYNFKVTATSAGRPVTAKALEQRIVYGVNTSNGEVSLNIGAGEHAKLADVVEFGG